jgi:hypothetical protein
LFKVIAISRPGGERSNNIGIKKKLTPVCTKQRYHWQSAKSRFLIRIGRYSDAAADH